MLIDNTTFKKLRDTELLSTILCCQAILSFGYDQIPKNSPLYFYIMDSGLLGDISYDKKLFLDYSLITSVSVKTQT